MSNSRRIIVRESVHWFSIVVTIQYKNQSYGNYTTLLLYERETLEGGGLSTRDKYSFSSLFRINYLLDVLWTGHDWF